MGKIYLVRHGTTKLNTDGDRTRGWMDVPLDSEGKNDAYKVADKLKDVGLDGVVTSDLGRAVDTARAISDATGAPILTKTMGLRPWNLGSYQGQKWSDIKDELEHLMRNPSMEAPGGESFNGFKSRAIASLLQLPTYKDKNIAVVTHHRVDRLVEAWGKAGYKRDGAVDIETMLRKGLEPGNYRVLDYPNPVS